MQVQARIRVPGGQELEVGHGDLIGRLWYAAVHLDDPRISEAHGLFSLRGGALRLLGLRGRFAVDGRPTADVELAPGLKIILADGLALEVLAVDLPSHALGLVTDGMPPRMLPGTCALVHDPTPTLAPPTDPRARAWLWRASGGWRIRVPGQADRGVADGDELAVDGRRWRVLEVPTGVAADPTRAEGGIDQPLRIVARYSTVHVFRQGHEPLLLQGLSARLVSELVAFGCPVPWTTLVEELWPTGGSRKQLDMALVRLRARLREARVRTDLVRPDGCGSIELVLRPGDLVEDAL